MNNGRDRFRVTNFNLRTVPKFTDKLVYFPKLRKKPARSISSLKLQENSDEEAFKSSFRIDTGKQGGAMKTFSDAEMSSAGRGVGDSACEATEKKPIKCINNLLRITRTLLDDPLRDGSLRREGTVKAKERGRIKSRPNQKSSNLYSSLMQESREHNRFYIYRKMNQDILEEFTEGKQAVQGKKAVGGIGRQAGDYPEADAVQFEIEEKAAPTKNVSEGISRLLRGKPKGKLRVAGQDKKDETQKIDSRPERKGRLAERRRGGGLLEFNPESVEREKTEEEELQELENFKRTHKLLSKVEIYNFHKTKGYLVKDWIRAYHELDMEGAKERKEYFEECLDAIKSVKKHITNAQADVDKRKTTLVNKSMSVDATGSAGKRMKVLLFDLDETLISSSILKAYKKGYEELFRENGEPYYVIYP